MTTAMRIWRSRWWREGERRANPSTSESPAVHFVFDESRATFDPVAVVARQKRVDRVDSDVNDAVGVTMACFGDEGVLMVADGFDRVLDLVLEIGLQRLARESKLAADLC